METPVNNASRYEAACECMPGGVNTSLRRISPPLVFTRAHGTVVTDVEGREYIDYQAAPSPTANASPRILRTTPQT